MGEIKLTKVGENTLIKGEKIKPFDEHSWILLNTLLGNETNASVLELGDPLPEFLFESASLIAFGGAEIYANSNNRSLKSNNCYQVEAGDRLKFEEIEKGRVVYLAVKGGFEKSLEGKEINELISFKIDDYKPYPNFRTLGIGRGLGIQYHEELKVRINIKEKNLLTDISKLVIENDQFKVKLTPERDSLFFVGGLLELKSKKSRVEDCLKGDLFLDEEGKLFCALYPMKSKIKIGKIFFPDISNVVQTDEYSTVHFLLESFDKFDSATINFKKQLNILQAAVNFEQNRK